MSAARWQQLLLEPAGLTDDNASAWFDAIARRMLSGCRLMVNDKPHRYTEIEFYYHGGPHLDVFTHRDPIQKETGRWYFHRTAGVYRGGSFKGHDLTFGGSGAFGGVLIRGIEQLPEASGGSSSLFGDTEPEGTLIDGPSLCVDHLLKTTGAASVAELDEAIEGRPCWDNFSPMHLVWLDEMRSETILKTARVGLSLKKLKKADAPTRFIVRRYRYLSEPRRISKGKQHMVLALHADGKSPGEIRDVTGCTKGAMERYLADYGEGLLEKAFDPYFGAELGPKELARMHGLAEAMFGKKGRSS